ncbi:MAG: SDR family oxidoreductase [Pseudomonadota bacterium]
MNTTDENTTDEKRVCIVTGSSSGIGAATALWFAQRGHHVVINYTRKAEAAQAVADQCRAAGAEVLVVRADIAEDAECRTLAEEVRQRWGGADTLVNNAGISPKFANLKDLDALSAEDFMDAWRVNVIGTFQMCRAVVPLMAGRTNPSIVNISSMAGVMGTGSSMAYAASKGGLNTLTLALARSLGPAIRVNAILPGMVNSEWLRQGLGAEKFEAGRQRYASRALLHTVIEGDDAANTAYWLALHATKLTGQLIQLDAGFMLG